MKTSLFYDVKATSILSALHCSQLLIDYLTTDPKQVSLVLKAFLLTSSWAIGQETSGTLNKVWLQFTRGETPLSTVCANAKQTSLVVSSVRIGH